MWCGLLKDYSCHLTGGAIRISETVRNCHFIFQLLTNFKASKRMVVDHISKFLID